MSHRELIKFERERLAEKRLMKQQNLAPLTYEGMKKRTMQEIFLDEMERVMPWESLVKTIRRVGWK